MITLHFSECCAVPAAGGKVYIERPERALYCGKHYERILNNANAGLKCSSNCVEMYTYDELCVLVAQYLKRTKGIDIQLVSWCQCWEPDEPPASISITLDADGSMNDDPHHGFFRQRMKYLR